MNWRIPVATVAFVAALMVPNIVIDVITNHPTPTSPWKAPCERQDLDAPLSDIVGVDHDTWVKDCVTQFELLDPWNER